ncbi:MAG: ABC transporter substrate-binding protein [Rhizobiales bacterium]|nr:ABC transporter substrate-binding protein [Hyphomicrobiales bacterium]
MAMQPVAAADQLTIASWGGAFQDAQAAAYFEPFAKEAGITINQDTWGGELAKVRAMVETGQVTWDLVVADYGHAIAGCAEGILEPIDYAALGNPTDLVAGTTHKCGVSSDVFALMFAYDPAKFPDGGPKTLADVFDTKKFPGKRGMRKQPKYVLEQALMADGVAPADVYKVLDTPEGVDRAFAKLDTIKSDIVWWSANAQAAQLLVDGEVAVSEIYNGRFYDAVKNSGKNLVPIWEGQVYSTDTWIIPKGANVALAHKFLAYMLQPKVLANFSNRIPYAPARTSALEFVSPEMAPFLPTAPQNFASALSSNEEWWADHDEALRERFESWLSQ